MRRDGGDRPLSPATSPKPETTGYKTDVADFTLKIIPSSVQAVTGQQGTIFVTLTPTSSFQGSDAGHSDAIDIARLFGLRYRIVPLATRDQSCGVWSHRKNWISWRRLPAIMHRPCLAKSPHERSMHKLNYLTAAAPLRISKESQSLWMVPFHSLLSVLAVAPFS